MPSTEARSSLWRWPGILICVAVLGLPTALVFTHGTILVPLVVGAVLAPFIVIHYVLWGWWLAPRPERDVPPLDSGLAPTNRVPDPPSEGIRSREQAEHFCRATNLRR